MKEYYATISKTDKRTQQINWDYLRNIDIEHAYKSFNDTLTIILVEIAPVTKSTLNMNILIRDPWMTKGLIKSSNTSKILHGKTLGKPKYRSQL